MSTDTYTVERSATIAAPPERIYQQVVDFHHWQRWSPWEDVDPGMDRSYSGPESGPGAAYAWAGNRKAGQGRMRILSVQEPTEVAVDLEFDKPFKSHNTFAFVLSPEGPDRTHVRWVMTGPRTLATKVMGLFTSMDKMVGPDFERGLARLKDVVETSAAP